MSAVVEPSRSPPDLSVVVPVYRNETTLEPLFERLCAAADAARVTLEVVFVDDASPDRSAARLAELAVRDPRVVVIARERNGGQHRAVRDGLRVARGEATVVLDADLQDPPEAVPALLATLATSGAEVVFATRVGSYAAGHRMLGSRAFKWLVTRLSRGALPDGAGLFVALTRTARERLAATPGERPHLLARLGRGDFGIASLPVRRAPRSHGESAWSEWMRLRHALHGIAQLVARRRR